MIHSSRLAMVMPFLLLIAARASAQELEARSYSPAPIGTTFVLAGYGRSEGAILLDPALDVENVEADLWTVTTGAARVFGLAGKQARLFVLAPYVWGEFTGDIAGYPLRQDITGFADPRVKFSLGIVGAPALTPEEFPLAPRSRVVAASVTVLPPIGQYDASKPASVGNHRWAFKPEIGMSRPIRRWTTELTLGCWFYTVNSDAFPAHSRKEQDPIGSVQAHASYTFQNRAWLAADATWFSGGRTTIAGIEQDDRMQNGRLGATLSYPIGRWHSLKLGYSTGATTRRGTDFDIVALTWQLVML